MEVEKISTNKMKKIERPSKNISFWRYIKTNKMGNRLGTEMAKNNSSKYI
jgi:hypothetical protein